MQLEILKIYIEAYLKLKFIRPSKSLERALILFHKNSDGSQELFVNYQVINNLTIKN